jgi:hypothetical protein
MSPQNTDFDDTYDEYGVNTKNTFNTPPNDEFEDLDDTYDEYGVNTKNAFNTPPKGE